MMWVRHLGGGAELSAQHPSCDGKGNLPDVMMFDIKTCTSLQMITLCEFIQHCVIVFHVVTYYITYLY
jgi:hypothetical protein